MSWLREKIAQERKVLMAKLNVSNVWALPRLSKVVVNVGLGRALVASSKPDDVIKKVSGELAAIAGQKPAVTKSKKSIASFKTRQGMPIGLKVTLHGPKMYDFLDRLVRIALPRTRDFRGLKESCADGGGNLNVGVRDHTVFPEASADAANAFGLEVTVVTVGSNRNKGLEFFRALGFPLEKRSSERKSRPR